MTILALRENGFNYDKNPTPFGLTIMRTVMQCNPGDKTRSPDEEVANILEKLQNS